jgi:erythromycin esterase
MITVAAAEPSVPDDVLQRWIEQNAIALPAGTPTDDDLAFLTDVIGDASIVQLGEASHAAGNGFALRARIVEFLHANLGFDVLIWEVSPGLVGTREIGGPRAPAEQIATMRREGFWGSASELDHLWSYASAASAGSRPLEMVSYDVVTTNAVIVRFAEGLASFLEAVPDPAASERLRSLADAAAVAAQISEAPADVPQKDVDDLIEASDALLGGIAEHRDALADAFGIDEVSFAERAVESLRTEAIRRAYNARASFAPGDGDWGWRSWHERDRQGARNLRWLIETEYPGRKIVIWAHNLHVVNASVVPGFGAVRPGRHDDLMIPIGVEVAERWRDRTYTIVLSHYDGDEGLAGTKHVTPLPLPPADSLDARLHALGAPVAFVDLRPLDRLPDHPMHQPQSLRLITHGFAGGRYDIEDVTAITDGILFIDRATPTARRTTAKD